MEVLPPGRRVSPAGIRHFLDGFVRRAVAACSPDALNVPEIVEENFRGEPYRRTLSPRAFREILREQLGGREVVVNKVVAHCRGGAEELAVWASAARDEGIESVVAVGGDSSHHTYPGPAVPEANRILREVGLCCGNILIPERLEEADRMREKTATGAEFFTTQALFAAEPLEAVLREYKALCEDGGLRPAAILVSLAPVSDAHDLEFLQWLGVFLGPEAEERLAGEDPGAVAAASIDHAMANWRRLQKTGAELGLSMGVNLEYISRHNFEAALVMGQRLAARRPG